MADFEDGDPGEQRYQRLPPEVYRRRRIVAALIALVVIGLVVWGVVFAVQRISASVGGGGAEASAAETENNNFASFSARPDSSGGSADPSGTASGSATGGPSASADPSATGEGSESPEPSESPGESEDPEESPSAEPSGQVQACGDSISVAASVNQESYAPGQSPVITATVVNDSENPCTVDPAGQVQYVITSGPAQVYDSKACGAAPEDGQEQTLEPGAEASQESTWNRDMTAYGCGDAATPAEPGYYWVTASVDGVASEPQLIRIEG
jgi:hypothetical protein